MNCEDPRMDIRELQLYTTDSVLTIASGGCNAFDYLIEGASVTAVDRNEHQIFLCELKMAICQSLDYQDAFRILGQGNYYALQNCYITDIRPMLSCNARCYWDVHIHSIRSSFIYTGVAGHLVWCMFRCIGEKRLKQHSWILDWLLPWAAPFAGVPKAQLEKVPIVQIMANKC